MLHLSLVAPRTTRFAVIAPKPLVTVGCQIRAVAIILLLVILVVVTIVAVKFIIVIVRQQGCLDMIYGFCQADHEFVEIFLVQENLVLIIAIARETPLAFRDGDIVVTRPRLLHIEKVSPLPCSNLG